MDHIVYLDYPAGEMKKMIAGSKTMIIRGAAGRKIPYGRVSAGDQLFFLNNNGEGLVKAKAVVKSVFNSEKMTKDESIALVNENMDKLRLSEAQKKRWAGKRYLVLIETENFQNIAPFEFNRAAFSNNMDDWLAIENIDLAKK